MKYLRYLHARYVLSLWRRAKLVVQDFQKNPPIIIYQMGKVGSSTVYESLKNAGLPNPIYHVHFLSYGNLEAVERYHQTAGAKSAIGSVLFWRVLRQKLDRTKNPVYLVSLVREPVSREISDLFQNMARHHKQLLTESGAVDVGKTVDFLYRGFAEFDEATDYACTWFDKEILDSFGLDVYAQPFDHSRGFVILRNDRASLLLLRMEDLSRVFEEAMFEFLGLSIPMRRANESSSKEHYQAYRAVLEKISLPIATGTKVYSSRYARHFYPDEVRAELNKKWMNCNSLESS